MKTVQYIRLTDVAVITPILMVASFKIGLDTPLGIAVMIIAVATLFYNGINFLNEL